MSQHRQQMILLIVLTALVCAFLLVTILAPLMRAEAQDIQFTQVPLDLEPFFYSRTCAVSAHLKSAGIIDLTGQSTNQMGIFFQGEYNKLPEGYVVTPPDWIPLALVVYTYEEGDVHEERFATVIANKEGYVMYLLSTVLPQGPEDVSNYDCGAYTVIAPDKPQAAY